jgi:hypothetical protein
MSRIFGQPKFFSYDSVFLKQKDKIKLNFGNFITINNNEYVILKRYNRRYIFNYINGVFVLNNIGQCPRKGPYGDSYKPFDVLDTNNLNSRTNHINLSINNPDTVLNSLPSVLNDFILKSIFSFPSSSYKYFLDCYINKRFNIVSSYENYTHNPFNIPQYYLNVGRYGLLDQNNQVLIFKERRRQKAVYINT